MKMYVPTLMSVLVPPTENPLVKKSTSIEAESPSASFVFAVKYLVLGFDVLLLLSNIIQLPVESVLLIIKNAGSNSKY